MARLTVRWTEPTGPPVNVAVGIDLVDQLIRDGAEQLVMCPIGANVDRAVRVDVDSRATSMRTGWATQGTSMVTAVTRASDTGMGLRGGLKRYNARGGRCHKGRVRTSVHSAVPMAGIKGGDERVADTRLKAGEAAEQTRMLIVILRHYDYDYAGQVAPSGCMRGSCLRMPHPPRHR